MASLITYSKRQLIQRLRQHLANDFPDAEFPISEREMLLYIDEALAFNLVGQVYAAAKIEGVLVVPEAYYITYSLPALVQDSVTSWWYTTLPQPPISLPLGYSIDHVYFASTTNGVSQPVNMIERKRIAYRNYMPKPAGANCWVEGSRIWVEANDGSPLSNQNLYVSMVTTRTENMNDTMSLPDDAIKGIFNIVIPQCIQRMQMPRDIIVDEVKQGNTNQKQ